MPRCFHGLTTNHISFTSGSGTTHDCLVCPLDPNAYTPTPPCGFYGAFTSLNSCTAFVYGHYSQCHGYSKERWYRYRSVCCASVATYVSNLYLSWTAQLNGDAGSSDPLTPSSNFQYIPAPMLQQSQRFNELVEGNCEPAPIQIDINGLLSNGESCSSSSRNS